MTESQEAPPDAGIDLDAIVAELDTPFGVLPEEAIKAARQHQKAMIPRLIALIEDATRAVQAGENVAKNGHFFALFLLGEWRARQALPAILTAIALPGEGPFELFGDAIHENLPAMLAALAGEKDLHLVSALIDNQALNKYVRWSAANALLAMVAAGIRTRDEIVALLRQSMRRAIDQRDTDGITGLVNALVDLYPEEAYAEIKEAYAKELVDGGFIDLSDVDHVLKRGRAECLAQLSKRTRPLGDTVEELRHWASFAAPDKKHISAISHPSPPAHDHARPDFPAAVPVTTIRRPEQRVGRNDPCPCSSGKKFKKCCGRRP